MSESEAAALDQEQALGEEQEHLDGTLQAFSQALAELTSRGASSGGDAFANEALEQLRRERIRVYTAASGPLYFGRIDRVKGGATYVGRHLVVDQRNRPLVINWRAPAAQPFYAATPRDPRGITLRRRLDIEGGRVLGFVDEGFAGPGEGHLTSAIIEDITRRRVGEMRQIIATITPEQYDVITEGPVPALVIQGGPGTGKTAVGLHRAAWLLYADPSLRHQGVLVVGPNRTFIGYIGQVLPALGEQAVEQRDIDTLVSQRHRQPEEPTAVATLKGDGRMAAVLCRLLWSSLKPPAEKDRFEVILGRRPVAVTGAEIVALIAAARQGARSYDAARARFRATLAERIAARAAERSRDPVLASASEIVTVVRKTSDYQRLAGRVWPRVTPERLIERLYKNRRRLGQEAAELLSDEEITLLLSLTVPARTVEMTASDVALLDEARWLIETDLRTFGHVVVDEAQNLTAMELRMVVRRARRQSLTILGDIAQRTTEAGLSSWDDVLSDAGVGTFVTRDLLVSYRVPEDFLRLAAAMAQVVAHVPNGVRRGEWPAVAVRAGWRAVGDTAVRLAAAMSREAGSVAIVTPDLRQTDVRAALASLEFADGADGHLSAGINLLDLHVVKGLEFDAVIVVDPQAILAQRPDGGRGALYTALTRSTRAVAIVTPDDLPRHVVHDGLVTVLPSAQPDVQWATMRRLKHSR